jgi:hypothetical protein
VIFRGALRSACRLVYLRGAHGSETYGAIIDMKPQPEPSTQEVLAGLIERVT